MNRISEGVRAFLYDKQRKGVRSAAALLLAVFVMLSVVTSLVRPAESITDPVSGTTPMPIEFSENGTGIYLISASATNADGQVVPEMDGETLKYKSFLSIKLSIDEDDTTALMTDPSYGSQVQFQLFPVSGGVVQKPEGFDIALSDQSLTSVTGIVVSSEDESAIIGRYVIDFENNTGTVTFDFDADYFKSAAGQGRDEIGAGLTFDAWCWNIDNTTNDKTVNLVGQDVTIPLHRALNHADIEVEKSYRNDFFYETAGESMNNRRCLGSSFNINIKSYHGIEGNEITITDDLNSNNVHFDRSEGYTETFPDGSVLEIIKITPTDTGEKLVAKIRNPDPDAFSNGFEYNWICPVAVNSEFLTEDGSAVDISKLEIIEGDNKVQVKSNDAEPVFDNSEAPIQVNLIADIAKYDGVYDPAENKIHWKYTIYKDNGWWQNGRLVIEDMFNDGSGNHTVKPSVSNVQIEAVPVVSGTSTAGVNIDYDDSDSTFVITMPTADWAGQSYSADQFKEFIITYDTDVTAADYGTTVQNWVGLRKPGTDEYTDEDTKPGSVPKPSVQKTGSYNAQNGTVTWTVTVDNPNNQKLNGLTVEDALTWTGGSAPQIDLSQATILGNTSGNIKASLTIDGGSITFPADGAAFTDSRYTISYTQTLDLDEAKGTDYTNTVSIDNGGDDPLTADSETVHIPEEFEVIKDSIFTPDGAVEYTVRVRNEYGSEVGGKLIEDTLSILNTSNASVLSDFSFEITGATAVESLDALTDAGAPAGLLYYRDASTGKVTLLYNGSKTDDLVITYKIRPADNSDIKEKQYYWFRNTAVFDENNKLTDTEDFRVPTSFTTLEKSYSYDDRTNLVTWTVTVNNPYRLDLGTYRKNGEPVKLYDTKFGTGVVESFKITDAAGNDVTAAGDLAAVNSSARESRSLNQWNTEWDTFGSFTFREGMDSEKYTFTYTTDYTAYLRGSQMDQNRADYDGRIETEPIYYATNGANISKTVYHSGAVDDEGRVQTRWTTRISAYEGAFLDYPVTDSMTSSLYDVSASTSIDHELVDHYMTPEQFDLDYFSFTAYDYDGTRLTVDDPSALFTLVRTSGTEDKITGFELRAKELSETSDAYALLSQIATLEIQYSTTEEGVGLLNEVPEEGEDPVMDLGDSLRYRNTAGFAGNTSYYEDTRVKRTAVTKADGNGNSNRANPTVYETGDLQTTEGGYLMSYRITVNRNNVYSDKENITAVDTLPPGFEFVSATYNLNNSAVWGAAMTEGTMEDAVAAARCRYDASQPRKVTFFIPASGHLGGEVQIDYTVFISEEDLNRELLDPENERIGRAKFENKIQVGDSFDSQPVVINDSSSVLDKVGEDVSPLDELGEVQQNKVSYTLDINPSGLDLALNSDVLRVTDTINKSEYSNEALCPILFNNLSYTAIKVYKITGSGEEEVKEELDPETYKMDQPTKQSFPVRNHSELGNGDVYTFTLEIPDETHIRIEYEYVFEFNSEAIADKNYDPSNMELKNAAVIDGEIADRENTLRMENANKNTHSGWAYTYPHLSLRKVSSDNWKNGLEGAQFVLARVGSSGTLEYVTSVLETENDIWYKDQHNKDAKSKVKLAVFGEGDPVPFTTGENGIAELPTLLKTVEKDGKTWLEYDEDEAGDQKYIYLLKEVKSPSGYYLPDETADYWFFDKRNSTDVPSEAVVTAMINAGLIASADEIHEHTSFSTIELENDKMVLSVEKSWEDTDSDDRPESISIQLWQSDEPKAPGGVHIVKVNVSSNQEYPERTIYSSIADGETFSFDILDPERLIYGAENLSGLSIGYTDWGQVTRIPVTSLTPVTSDAEFSVRVNTNTRSSFDTVEIRVTSAVVPNTDPGFVILNEEGGWSYTFDTSELDSTKYYFVTEGTEAEGYFVSYNVNGIRNGVLTLTNVKDEFTGRLELDKEWLGNDTGGTESVTFDIYGFTEQITQQPSQYQPGTAVPEGGFEAAVTTLPANTEDAVIHKEITVSAEGEWSELVRNLPMYENGDQTKPIYYYISERSQPDKFYPIDYSDNAFTVSNDETKAVTVLNSKVEGPPEYELPESGGEGTAAAILAGGTVMLLSAALLVRKRKSED